MYKGVLAIVFSCIVALSLHARAFALSKDARAKEMKYIHNVQKQEVKEEYEREKAV